MSSEKVTIGICAHNEEETIGTLIDQILEENLPVAEIIIVVAGEDSTADIVREKSRDHEKIMLIEEDEREGQLAAQNKIFSKHTGEAIILVDGDGTIEPDSLKRLYERFNGKNVVSGKEISTTENSFIGRIIDLHSKIHHELCLSKPRFSTQLGILPSDLINSFPENILDDIYIENKCFKNSIPLIYLPTAIKYHVTPNSFKFFFYQQRKNWLGRFEAEKEGYTHSKPDRLLLEIFLKSLKTADLRDLPMYFSLLVIEVLAYIKAKYDSQIGRAPIKWRRPEKDERRQR